MTPKLIAHSPTRFPSRRPSDFVVGTIKSNNPCEIGSCKEIASRNRKGNSKKPLRFFCQGAEAKIILNSKGNIVKDRIKKSYRIPELDNKIRRRRTKSEAKLLQKASEIINSPAPLAEPGSGRMIHMPFIKGKKLSEHLDKFDLKKQKQICKQIGESIAKLHEHDIIHGDLTTSNMILQKDKVFILDFGLGFISRKFEDKAVDLHLLKQALEAKHFKYWEVLFKEIRKAYSKYNEAEKVFNQLTKVEKRGRYKH